MKGIIPYRFGYALSALLLLGLGSCSRYDEDISAAWENRLALTFAKSLSEEMTSAESDAVYSGMCFLATEYSSGTYSHEVSMQRQGTSSEGGTVYKGSLKSGNDWGLAMASPKTAVTKPVSGAQMATATMYTMPEDAARCPEIFFNSIKLPNIIPDVDTEVEDPVLFARNMSQVTVRVVDRHGVIKHGTAVTVELHEVPSTISWTGAILPDTEDPTLRTAPVELGFEASETWTEESDGARVSPDHTTVIPAHRGSDFWTSDGVTMNPAPQDTLKHRMKIRLAYEDKNGNQHDNLTELKAVPEVPKCNGRIVYNLIPMPTNADVEIVTELLPWDVEDTQTEIEARPLKAANCVVVAPGRSVEFSVEDVYQAWNWEYTDKLDPNGKMDQSKAVEAVVLGGGDLIAAEAVNPLGSDLGPHQYIKVTTKGNGTGEAVVGMKLAGDAAPRWVWHVHVTDDPQALADGHCAWTTAGSGDRDKWGDCTPDREKTLTMWFEVDNRWKNINTRLCLVAAEPGALPYRVTLCDRDKSPTPANGEFYYTGAAGLQKTENGVIHVVPGHETDIWLQAFGNFTTGYLKIEQSKADGTYGTPKYVEIGYSRLRSVINDLSVSYEGQDGLSIPVSSMSVKYPTELPWAEDATVAGNWQATLCDENGNPAPSEWVTLTGATALGGNAITMNAAPQTDYFLEFESAPAVSNYDLSTRGGRTAMNTANCYIVNAPGTYSLPLVYGNAIKDGRPNPSAWTSMKSGDNILTCFTDHTGNGIGTGNGVNGQPMTDQTAPYINKKYYITDARLLWQDVDGMITDVATNGQNLTFRVTDKIHYGNAVVAAFSGNDIVWSWHIWVTNYDPYAADGTILVENHTGTPQTFMKENVGFCPGVKYEARTQHLLLTETTTGATTIVTVNQLAGQGMGNNTYYQWGRKDPMPGVILKDGVPNNKQTYGPEEYIWPASGQAPGSQRFQGIGRLAMPDWIKKPHQLNVFAGMDNLYDNLWSADNDINAKTSPSLNTNVVVKTVYDPSPAGFCVPPNGAFSGFSKTGEDINTTLTEFKTYANVDGNWDKGWHFWTKTDGTGSTLFFPALGSRLNNEVSSFGNEGVYHTVIPYLNYHANSFRFAQSFLELTDYNSRNNARSVRPVKEQE